MNRVLLSALSALAIGAIAPAAGANTTAFDLVNLARNGYFKDQGIPSHAALAAHYQAGHVTAEALVKAAVETNRLEVNTLQDEGFLRSVETQLADLNTNR